MFSSKSTLSGKHKNIAGYFGMKNETQSKIDNHGHMNNHQKCDSINHSIVNGIKHSKKDVPMNTYTKIGHSGNNRLDKVKEYLKLFLSEMTGEHAYGKTKHFEVTNTRGILRKSNVHKQQMDKHVKIDHSEIDQAVFISISVAPEKISPANPDITEQKSSE